MDNISNISRNILIVSTKEGRYIAERLKEIMNQESILSEIEDELFNSDLVPSDLFNRHKGKIDYLLLIIKGEYQLHDRSTPKNITFRDKLTSMIDLSKVYLGENNTSILYHEKCNIQFILDKYSINGELFKDDSLCLSKSGNTSDVVLRNIKLSHFHKKGVEIYDNWGKHYDPIMSAFENSDINSKLRIIQTWLPDRERFIPDLARLLKNDKRFS